MKKQGGKLTYGENVFFSTFTVSTLNCYRGAYFAQPRALENNDVLSPGKPILRVPSEMRRTDRVAIFFKNNEKYLVPPRLPVALNGYERPVLPQDLKIGEMLMTGCVVLDDPIYLGPEPAHFGQNEWLIRLSGNGSGDKITTPAGIPLAVSPDYDPLSGQSRLSQFAIHRLIKMDRSAIECVADFENIQNTYLYGENEFKVREVKQKN